MSLVPKRPAEEDDAAADRERIRILEALTPGGSLITTDGSLTVDPTDELFIGSGITLTNPSAGVAALAAAQIGPGQTYSMVVTGSVSDPTTAASGASFVELGTDTGCLVYVKASVSFGPPINIGSGDWRFSLPVPAGGGSFAPGGIAWFLSDDTNPPPFTHWAGLHLGAVDTNWVTFAYADAYPVGNYVTLGSSSMAGSPWTLANVDLFECEFFYSRA